jgi:hypothetical protein
MAGEKRDQGLPIWASVLAFVALVVLVYGCSILVNRAVDPHHHRSPALARSEKKTPLD